MGDLNYPIGGKDFRGGKPMFFNKRRRHGGGPRRPHFGLAEGAAQPVIPPLPDTPTPAAFEANVFGRLDKRLQYAIADAGYAVPTPIQEKAMPFVLDGRDLIGCAQTGTGKTAAFMLPILNHLFSPAARPFRAGHPRALILSPTRELAAQTAENDARYSKYSGTPFAVVFGGVSAFQQIKAVQKGAQVVIATPGRLLDLMTQGVLFLDAVEIFVLDEADRMLDMGFMPDIKRIISKLPGNRQAGGAFGDGEVRRQTLFFSATLAPQILKLAGQLVVDPMQIMISPETPTVDKIKQSCMMVEKGNKDALLIHLLENHPEWYRVIVFARTRHGADRVERKLSNSDISVAAIHSDKSQNQRTRALTGFKSGKIRVLVATDIASRGIDVQNIDLVVNMDLPIETESYVHRIGRTARAGESGAAISFVAPEERALLKAVERFIKKTVPVDRDQPFHSEAAERKAGKQGQGLPQAPWIRGGERNKNGARRLPGAVRSGPPRPGAGRNGPPRQPGRGPAPYGAASSEGGAHRRPDGKVWQKRDDQKFVHPANAKRSHHNRTNFEGRREPDFGQR